MKCCTRDAPIVLRNAWNPAPPISFGPSLIGSAVVLLYPHFAIIFGNETDSIFFTCLSIKKDCASGYSTFGRNTPWYSTAASRRFTPDVNRRYF